MANPLYEKYSASQPNQRIQNGLPDPFGSVGGMQSKWNDFVGSYHGDAQQDVQNLLNSGRMNPMQYKILSTIAQRIAPFLGR